MVHLPSQRRVCDEIDAQIQKSCPVLGEYFLVPRASGGDIGGVYYLQVGANGYLTRPWAVGPANFQFSVGGPIREYVCHHFYDFGY